MLDERFQIAGERVVVIADGRLAGAAKATAVVGDDTISIDEQVPLLPFPRVAIQRIAMDQNDRLAAPVILVVNIDRAIVLGSDDKRGHLFVALSRFLLNLGYARVMAPPLRRI